MPTYQFLHSPGPHLPPAIFAIWFAFASSLRPGITAVLDMFLHPTYPNHFVPNVFLDPFLFCTHNLQDLLVPVCECYFLLLY